MPATARGTRKPALSAFATPRRGPFRWITSGSRANVWGKVRPRSPPARVARGWAALAEAEAERRAAAAARAVAAPEAQAARTAAAQPSTLQRITPLIFGRNSK